MLNYNNPRQRTLPFGCGPFSRQLSLFDRGRSSRPTIIFCFPFVHSFLVLLRYPIQNRTDTPQFTPTLTKVSKGFHMLQRVIRSSTRKPTKTQFRLDKWKRNETSRKNRNNVNKISLTLLKFCTLYEFCLMNINFFKKIPYILQLFQVLRNVSFPLKG